MKKITFILIASLMAIPSLANAAQSNYGASVNKVSHSILSSNEKLGLSVFMEKYILLSNKKVPVGLEFQTLGSVKGYLKDETYDTWNIYSGGVYSKYPFYARKYAANGSLTAFLKLSAAGYLAKGQDHNGSSSSLGYNWGLGIKYDISKDYSWELLYARHTANMRNKSSEKIAGTLGISFSMRISRNNTSKKGNTVQNSENNTNENNSVQEYDSENSESSDNSSSESWKNTWAGNDGWPGNKW